MLLDCQKPLKFLRSTEFSYLLFLMWCDRSLLNTTITNVSLTLFSNLSNRIMKLTSLLHMNFKIIYLFGNEMFTLNEHTFQQYTYICKDHPILHSDDSFMFTLYMYNRPAGFRIIIEWACCSVIYIYICKDHPIPHSHEFHVYTVHVHQASRLHNKYYNCTNFQAIPCI